MTEVDADYSGMPFGGVAIICKKVKSFSFYELATRSDRVIAVAACGADGKMVQMFCFCLHAVLQW